jgi:hypothetical protein
VGALANTAQERSAPSALEAETSTSGEERGPASARVCF